MGFLFYLLIYLFRNFQKWNILIENELNLVFLTRNSRIFFFNKWAAHFKFRSISMLTGINSYHASFISKFIFSALRVFLFHFTFNCAMEKESRCAGNVQFSCFTQTTMSSKILLLFLFKMRFYSIFFGGFCKMN